MKQLEVLNEYYTNLDYDIDKEKALKIIDELSETVRFHESVNFSERLKVLANIIQENISHFKSVCRHVDIIDTIVEYLNFYATQIKRHNDDTSNIVRTSIFVLMITLSNICDESTIQSFLLYPILTNSTMVSEDTCQQITNYRRLLGIEVEMIILQDSDLHAIINYLIITENFTLCKIWVQEQVKEKFLWLVKGHCSDITAYEDLLRRIHTFQSLKDIHLDKYETNIHIVSIWSEDIAVAKNLALSLNSHIIFINAHMDISGTAMLFPYEDIFQYVITQRILNKIREEKSVLSDTEQSINVVHVSHIAEMNFTSIFNLFYDGTWQEPVKGMYWKHNDNLWANATNDDIIRCYDSAEKGFKTWSVKSVKTRIQILSKLVPILQLNGKPVLAAIVTRWLKFPYLFNIRGRLCENGKVETTEIRKALGVIILREENENVLFFRLMQTLIAGNSVIVMFGANFCNPTPYCDMFSTCGIPPGVINLLSHENTNMLEYKLCSAKYTDYADKIFLKGNSKETYIEPYINLTICKSIIVRLT